MLWCCFDDRKGLRQRCRDFNLKILWKGVKVWFITQFTPSAEVELLASTSGDGNFKSLLISWIVLVHITCHIIGGTLTFSSLIFITVRDAVTVISRYLASLSVCQVILTYELAVLRDKYRKKDEGQRKDGYWAKDKYRARTSTQRGSDGELQALRMTSHHSFAETEYGYKGEVSEPRGFRARFSQLKPGYARLLQLPLVQIACGQANGSIGSRSSVHK